MKIALDWQISSYFGWGVYGLNLALEWASDPDVQASGIIRSLDEIALDRLRKRALVPFVANSMAPPAADAVMIHSLGNEAGGYLTRPSKIAAIFFEHPLSPAAIERLKRYDVIVAGSTWNAVVLRSHGVGPIAVVFQGVDRSLFHPAPKRGLYPGKFLIFSGGKAEPRKGQDLVVKAFRAFAQLHADAMLVTAWDSPWPHLRKGMDLDLSGLADRVIDVGALPNGAMAPVYRECDVALFPNRAEGGTNLVAMECIACGLPTIVANNTGQKDLVGLPGVTALHHWGALEDQGNGWGESHPDDILEALERAYARRGAGDPPEGLPRHVFQWSDTAKQLTRLVAAHQTERHTAHG